MRYAHIVKAVVSEPWLITPQAHGAIVQLLKSKLGASAGEVMDATRSGFKDEPLPSMTVQNGIAAIPIRGILANRVSPIEKSCGVTDYADIDRDLKEAVSRQDVKAIVLDIDSPGGAVAGLSALAHRVSAIHSGPNGKRIVAYTGGEMASAALFLGVGAQAVYADRGALIGSVGTVLPFIDESEAFAKEGLKVQLITSTKSPLKGTAWPGTSLSDEQRTYLQNLVDQMDADFRGFVKQHRPRVSDEALRGQIYPSAEALKMGMVDAVVAGIEDVFAQLN
jgi:ClpP class serine protease